MDQLEAEAPGLLSVRLREGLCGHHPLFPVDEIRAAFASPDAPLSREQVRELGDVLLVIAREPIDAVRDTIEALPPSSRDALIRIYFRLLDRAAAERAETQ